jgi:Plavaka transposase
LILGADKTTVSVATGDIEYHPLYLSIGNVHNTIRRGHRNAVVPIAFLAIPKGKFTAIWFKLISSLVRLL